MEILSPGTVVDRKYEVISPIAQGGMGAVYRARHLLTEQVVALKVLFVGAGDEAVARRFKLEVSVAAKVKHPGIVRVYDAGTDSDSGRLYLAMELLEGESLRHYMDEAGADTERIVGWLADTADVMAAAHAEGVVHRDLKPENLFLERLADGTSRLRVLDFGIARDVRGPSATTTGVAVGTALYMSPEQAIGGKGVGPESDVWALGAMLYEGLTNMPPFDGPSAHAVIVEAVTAPHRPLLELRPELSEEWSDLVDQCLQKKPEGRPRAAEVRAAIGELLERHEPLAAPFPLARRAVREDLETADPASLEATAPAPDLGIVVGAGKSLRQPIGRTTGQAPPRRSLYLGVGVVALALITGGVAWLTRSAGQPPSAPTTIEDPPPVAAPALDTLEAPSDPTEAEPTPIFPTDEPADEPATHEPVADRTPTRQTPNRTTRAIPPVGTAGSNEPPPPATTPPTTSPATPPADPALVTARTRPPHNGETTETPPPENGNGVTLGVDAFDRQLQQRRPR